MPKPILSFSPTPSQELSRVTILIPRNREPVPAVRLESACLSECVREAWHLVQIKGTVLLLCFFIVRQIDALIFVTIFYPL